MDTEELDAVVGQVRRFVQDVVRPLEDRIEDEDEVPAEVVEQAKAMGLYGFTIPVEHGGLGLSVTEEVELVQELGQTTPALRSLFGTNNGIAGNVLREGGTAEQKASWLPRLASGEVVASFALTEDGAGSDPSGLRTVARRDGDGWVIDGAKKWITNAPVADVLMVFARTDPDATGSRGISTFLVPADAEGVTIGPRDAKMGQKGAWTSEVFLDGVRVGDEALIGGDEGLGNGFRVAMACLGHGRVHIAAACVGMGIRLVEEAVGFAAVREQGGKVIGEHQLIQGLLADMQTDVLAGQALMRQAAAAYDAGGDVRVQSSAAKLFCSEMVGRVADAAVQVHGGAGYMRGIAVERFYRDARLFRIYEGTSQIQQLIIGRALVRDARAKLDKA